jgi:hypothetical protein
MLRLIAALNLPAPPLVFDFTSKNLMVERLAQCVQSPSPLQHAIL